MIVDYTVLQVARLVGASRLELVRDCNRGTFPQAYLDSDGQWRIPYTDLVNTGRLIGLSTDYAGTGACGE